jgi:membrane-bound lytic murein transglycosylase F
MPPPHRHPFREHPGRHVAYAFAGAAIALLSTCSPRVSVLERVRAEGVLRVAAVNGPTGCYQGPNGVVGYECELLTEFAHGIGARVDVDFFDTTTAVINAVRSGAADLGAGGINITDQHRLNVNFGPPLRTVAQQLVYNANFNPPTELDRLDGHLVVIAGSSAAEALRTARKIGPETAAQSGPSTQRGSVDAAIHDLSPGLMSASAAAAPVSRSADLRWDLRTDLHWDETTEDSAEDLLLEVADGDLDYTIANSDLVAMGLHYYPKLRVAFDVTAPQPLGWALPRAGSASLNKALAQFLASKPPDELARLDDRYFGHINALDYEDVNEFSTKVQARLPRYQRLFEAAGQRYNIDWHVLAAMGYQESRWDPGAISHTQVRGLMMLTEETAQRMGVADRGDPGQSILGGARYLAELRATLPDSVTEPDRTWMALAAYNQGLGHLLDARQLVTARGGNPDHWVEVRDTLPLLTRPVWFAKTRYGYARGREAVDFVANIRSYSDILAWMSDTGSIVATLPPTAGPVQLASRSATISTIPH